MAKPRHIAAKLRLEPGMTVPEIGSGWGALGAFLARNCGVRVTSVTLSPERCAAARQRAIDAGVTDLVEFRAQDHRLLEGTCDRVVSIAMSKPIGFDAFDTYFRLRLPASPLGTPRRRRRDPRRHRRPGTPPRRDRGALNTTTRPPA